MDQKSRAYNRPLLSSFGTFSGLFSSAHVPVSVSGLSELLDSNVLLLAQFARDSPLITVPLSELRDLSDSAPDVTRSRETYDTVRLGGSNSFYRICEYFKIDLTARLIGELGRPMVTVPRTRMRIFPEHLLNSWVGRC